MLLVACDEKAAPAPVPSASVAQAPEPPPPPREGCTRVGSLQTIEGDPTCAFHAVGEEVMRTSMKHLALAGVAEPAEVAPGTASNITITIANTSEVETLVVLETRTRVPGPQTDWARIAGIPEARAPGEGPHVFFALSTLDARAHDVDALPTLVNAPPVTAAPQAIAIHLRPHGKLTHTFSWWAYRIPAPAPIVKDDAGHRFVPKTSALPLDRGEYSVVVDVPLFALSPEERKLSTRLKVVRVDAEK